MVGLSHVAFREWVNEYVPVGLSVLRFTEMLSSRRLPSERLDHSNELRVAKGESGYIPQILGNEEKFIGGSFRKLDALDPWGYDINMGCPVEHTLKHNWGVRLMGDPGYAGEVVRMARAHTDKPLSVKMRGGAGEELDFDYLARFTDALESNGADWMTIHARPRAKKHTGTADWSLVGRVAKIRSVPIVANGDIQTSEDAIKVVRESGAAGAMIARAATVRPWIFWQIAEDMGLSCKPRGRDNERAPRTELEEGAEYLAALQRLAELFDEHFASEDYKLKKLRFLIATGSKWFNWGHAFWRHCTKGNTVGEVKERIAQFAASHEFPMKARTNH